MSISIGQHFQLKTLLKFAFPSIIMMVFMSLYTIIDGMFVSRYVGSDALSSVNIVYPVISIFTAIGIMLATGGCAVIAKKLGEGNRKEARSDLTLFVVIGGVIGVVLSLLVLLFSTPIVKGLGANEALLGYCTSYLRILMYFAPVSVLQLLFLSFFVAASRPGLGLWLTVSGGIINIVLDYVLLGLLGLGIEGAAIATGLGQLIPAVAGLLFFAFPKKELHFSKFQLDGKVLLQACSNGSSEMVTHLSNAVVTFLFNILMMRLIGEAGVAAITIVLYGQFLFNSLYLGFSMGIAPILSFNLGSKNTKELRNVFRLSVLFVVISSLVVAVLSYLSAHQITGVFVPRSSETFALASTGFALFSLNYIVSGSNIFASSLFTALSDGKTSAIISFCRTFLCMIVSLLVLPYFFGVTGVWLAVPVAEFVTIVLSIFMVFKKNKTFHYL